MAIFDLLNFITMKTLKLFLILLGVGLSAFAREDPDTSYWMHSGKIALKLSQVGLSNWSGGGEPSVSIDGILNYMLKYEKEPHLWETKLDAGYGTQRIGGNKEPFTKTDDYIILISRYGYQLRNKWYASAIFDFRTQFYRGFSYDNDTTVYISNFMAPAYSKLGIGITYNHKFSDEESFSATFSPFGGKTTFVLDDELSESGAYGVDPGEKTKTHMGMDLSMGFNKELIKNVTLTTTLALFSRYTDLAVVDVNWDLTIWLKINEFLSANITTQLIYNQDIEFVNPDGSTYGSAVQFKEVLGLGLAYSF
jgi:hypothetical protein